MRKQDMFRRIIIKSLLNRRRRIGVAVVAIVLGAAMVSALISTSLDTREKAGRELSSYGANILLLPRATSLRVGTGALDFGSLSQQGFIAEDSLEALGADDPATQISALVPYLYGVVEVGGQRVVLAGTRFAEARKASPWWQIAGRWPDHGASTALVGSEVARKLGLGVGDAFEVQYDGRRRPLEVSGVVETGAGENSQILVGLETAQELFDQRGQIGLAQVRATADRQPLAATVSQIERKMPQVRARVIGQIAEAEMSVLGKVELLMAIVAVLVLLASTLTAAGTMATTVLERTREIGLLKALGASQRHIVLLFVAEAAVLGAVGGILGYLAGFVIAQGIGHWVFDSSIAFNPVVLPLSVLVGIGVAIVASAVPVRSAVEIDPAITLRGE
ncbi:MAG: ABC transporter permease [Chloroflexi bacterium]|nr:ABC transporter permease [Chloroflexota bacterium]